MNASVVTLFDPPKKVRMECRKIQFIRENNILFTAPVYVLFSMLILNSCCKNYVQYIYTVLVLISFFSK